MNESLLRKYVRTMLEFSIKGNKQNLSLDMPSKTRGYMSGHDISWSGKETNEEIYDWAVSMGLLESYGSAASLVPDPPDIEYRVNELPIIARQIDNPKNDPSMFEILDKNIEELFDKVIKNAGYESHREVILGLKEKVRPAIVYHKELYGQKRPKELAKSVNFTLNAQPLESAQTPSYPSGHAAEAYYIAHALSDKFSDLSPLFYRVAQMIADSRIDMGAHFPSDISAGKILADALFSEAQGV